MTAIYWIYFIILFLTNQDAINSSNFFRVLHQFSQVYASLKDSVFVISIHMGFCLFNFYLHYLFYFSYKSSPRHKKIQS